MAGYHFLFVLVCLGRILCQDFPGRYRLGNDVTPKFYRIKIHPFEPEKYFLGEVLVVVYVKHSLKTITMNSRSIKISDITLDNYKNETGFAIQDVYELLHIFKKDHSYIDPGEHIIYIKYKGIITSNSTGIFRSGDSIAAMFSATYARMAFPCFDDPAFKAKFAVRIVKPDDTYEALSNMEEINSFRTNEGVVVDFRTTPPISPYVLCFLITKYKNTPTNHTSIDGRLIPIRVFLMDDYVDQAPFILEVAKNSLTFFEEYTKLPYPSSKLDIIELKDFNAEGEENMGLITLMHNIVTFNESLAESKPEHLRNGALLIVHEIAHMWFGDAVTHHWYNDLWLTEGFAEFMERKGLRHQYPHWKGMETILRQRFSFYNDIQTIPITTFSYNDDQVEQQFEDLTYVKGASILTMLEIVMGPDAFKAGVRNYLKNYNLRTVSTGNFISIMQKYSQNSNLWDFLQSWLYQSSYPLVLMFKNSFRKKYIIKQISIPGSSSSGSIFGHKWTIPITYTSSCNGSVSMKWLDRDAEELYITQCEDEKWTKLNHNGLSYYRVLYTKQQYQELMDNFEELTDDDQGNLIDDAFHLTRERLLSCEIPLKLIGKMRNSAKLLPVTVSLLNIRMVLNDAKDHPQISEKLKAYFTTIFENLYNELSWSVKPNEDLNTRNLRTNLLQIMCGKHMKYDRCFNDVLSISKNNSFSLHSDLVNVFTEAFINMEKTKKAKTSKKYNLKSIFSLFFRDKITVPEYIRECLPWY